MRKFLPIGLFVFVLLALLIKYGRSLYVPVTQQITGKQTVVSVQEKLEAQVLDRLHPHLQRIGLTELPKKLLLVGLKEEQQLEVYVKQDTALTLLTTYPFTAFSGRLGPKLQEGDRQIPEGLYRIEYLNPNSSYHLSLKVNYPNVYDREKAQLDGRVQLGGDIFIHGKAVTIGCIPIGDPAIEELFVLASYAQPQGIDVIISPWDFRKKTHFPNIESIEWESELYSRIQAALEKL